MVVSSSSRSAAGPLHQTSRDRRARPTLRSAAEEAGYRLRYRLALLEMRQVPGSVDQFDARALDPRGEFLRVGGGDDAVRLAPHDQGRRHDAVRAVLQAAVGNRPDELAG